MVEGDFLGVELLLIYMQRCQHIKSDIIRQYMSELSRLFFYCSRYFHSINYPQAKNIPISIAINLERKLQS